MPVEFRYSTGPENIITYLTSLLSAKLSSGVKVLWLVPGGSALEVAARVSKLLPKEHLENLTVTLTDERYGEVGHKDSNWQQLLDAGFELPGANLLPVLHGKGLSETADDFSEQLQKTIPGNSFRLGFFGIGPDGHTAGILPGSPAVNSEKLAAGYEDSDDTGLSPERVKRGIDRITVTPKAIAMLDEVVVYAAGEAKWPVLKRLEQDIAIREQPAQALKQVAKVTIFSDYNKEGNNI